MLAMFLGLNIGLFDAYFFKVYHQSKLKIEIVHLSKFQNNILYQSKLNRTWRKGSEICLRYPLDIYFHTFSRYGPETPNLTCFKIAPKLEKSIDHEHNI